MANHLGLTAEAAVGLDCSDISFIAFFESGYSSGSSESTQCVDSEKFTQHTTVLHSRITSDCLRRCCMIRTHLPDTLRRKVTNYYQDCQTFLSDSDSRYRTHAGRGGWSLCRLLQTHTDSQRSTPRAAAEANRRSSSLSSQKRYSAQPV